MMAKVSPVGWTIRPIVHWTDDRTCRPSRTTPSHRATDYSRSKSNSNSLCISLRLGNNEKVFVNTGSNRLAFCLASLSSSATRPLRSASLPRKSACHTVSLASMNHRYFKMGAVPVSDTARYGYVPIRPDARIGKYREILI